MMANKITATIEFYFKGEQFSPSVTLDLDELMQQHGTFPELHQMLAQLNDIDSYSYEYEIMLAEEVQFSNAQGSVKQFFFDGSFDQAGYEQQWHENNVLLQLSSIIKQQLNIDDIQQHPELKKVILTAYQYGKKNSKAD